MSGKMKILLVDDEKNFVDGLAMLLEDYNFECRAVYDGRQALKVLAESSMDVVVTDLLMPVMDGFEFLKEAGRLYPDIPSIVLTAHGGDKENRQVRELGAKNFVIKPVDVDQLANMIDGLCENIDLKKERDSLREKLEKSENEKRIRSIVGRSSKTQELVSTIMTVAPTNLSILITGESGVGKQLVAESIHNASLRCKKPFVDTHCAAFAQNLLEDELFGHEKGAFTGAISSKKGIFVKADGGTLFLDEIGEIPLSTQVKLLKVLEEKKFVPLGSDKEVVSDFRLICATNRNLENEVEKGTFREDLYYRINKMNIQVPPLRERESDIVILANEFARRFAKEYNKSITGVSQEVVNLLLSYRWPGNIRELENVMESAVVMSRTEEIVSSDLPSRFVKEHSLPTKDEFLIKLSALSDMEMEIIQKTLERCGGNKSKAADILGITRKTLATKISEKVKVE